MDIRVGKRAQVVIPAGVRAALGIAEGDVLRLEVDERGRLSWSACRTIRSNAWRAPGRACSAVTLSRSSAGCGTTGSGDGPAAPRARHELLHLPGLPNLTIRAISLSVADRAAQLRAGGCRLGDAIQLSSAELDVPALLTNDAG